VKIRVQREDGLWELIDLPSGETSAMDLDTNNCIFAGRLVNHYFNQEGYYIGPGRSMEAMRDTHSIEGAEAQEAELESSRTTQDVLDSDELDV
jgi:hypothetical protein